MQSDLTNHTLLTWDLVGRGPGADHAGAVGTAHRAPVRQQLLWGLLGFRRGRICACVNKNMHVCTYMTYKVPGVQW